MTVSISPTDTWVIPLEVAGQVNGGGKALGLAELLRAGLPVPDGFVITADAYRAATGEIDTGALLARRGPGAVRAQVESQEVPDAIREQIHAHLATWGEEAAVAVRSSATAEDQPDASFAGQQDTFLGVVGPDAVLDAVRRCWGSLWTDRAVDYRSRSGYDRADVALAVVVQRMVDADVAGVMFTTNPVNGADEVLINASWGLGESVVSGAVTPDEYRATSQMVLERSIGSKQIRIDRVKGSTATTQVPEQDRGVSCLEDSQVLALAALGADIATHFGKPMDIEWALEGENLWLLQARPITTQAPRDEDVTVPEQTTTGHRIGAMSRTFHADLVEHYPGPYPLDLAAITRMHAQLQKGMRAIGITSTPIDQLISMDDDGAIRVGFPDVSVGPAVLRLLSLHAPDPRSWSQIEQQFRAELGQAEAVDLSHLSDTELFTQFDKVLDIADRIALVRFQDYVGPGQLIGIRLQMWLKFARRSDVDVHDLLRDLDFTTAVIDRDLKRLSALDPVDPIYAQRRREFLANHGARTSKMYLPFSNRSWGEDPTSLDAMVDTLRRAPVSRHGIESHARMVTNLEAHIPVFLRRCFRRDLNLWRTGHVAREASVYLIEQAYVVARCVTDEIARRLMAGEVLATVDDLKYLTIQEIHVATEQPATPGEWQRVVDRRRRARPRAAAQWWLGLRTDSGNTLKGVAGSPGLVTGPARVIDSPSQFGNLQPGDVLVCRYTDPSWTPLFALAVGVVADTGGRLSHAAIVAREYGIPAVMGTGSGTQRIVDGDMVTVDGTKGIVTPFTPERI